MADEQKAKRLEIAHVLFMDIVGYSKLLTDEQSEALQELNQIVRSTEAAREAEAAGQLTILPTGDGMALVFTGSVEEPVECALEISHALRAQPSLPVRMGIHSGPVHHVKDANERENIAGVGINIAQRVMDCGDAGHILISKSLAEILGELGTWVGHLHDIGVHEVKHGVKVHLVNLYSSDFGNPEMPQKLRPAAPVPVPVVAASQRGRYMLAGGALALTVLIASAVGVSNWLKTRAAPGQAPPVAAPAPTPQLPAPAPTPAPAVVPPEAPPTVAAPAVEPPRATPSRRPEAKSATPAPPQAPAPIQQPPPVVRVPSPAPPQAPASPAAATPSGPDRAALQEVRERMILLSSRAGAVQGSLQNLEREQSRSGLSLRGDMGAAAQRVQFLMGEANRAVAAGDAAAAKRNLDQAESNLEKLEKFLGL